MGARCDRAESASKCHILKQTFDTTVAFRGWPAHVAPGVGGRPRLELRQDRLVIAEEARYTFRDCFLAYFPCSTCVPSPVTASTLKP